MRHESFVTRSKFLITRERAKPRFRAKIGEFRANRAVSRQDGWAGLTHEEMAFVFLWVLLFSRWSVSVLWRAESELLGFSCVVCSVSVTLCAVTAS